MLCIAHVLNTLPHSVSRCSRHTKTIFCRRGAGRYGYRCGLFDSWSHRDRPACSPFLSERVGPDAQFLGSVLAGSSVGGASEALVCILPGPASRACLFATFRLNCLVYGSMTSADILHDRGPCARIEQAAPIQHMLQANPRNLLMESCCLTRAPISGAATDCQRKWTGRDHQVNASFPQGILVLL